MTKEEVLSQCIVQDNVVKLPDIQLDRDLYLQVKKAMAGIGGSWKGGKIAGFVFSDDPTDLLVEIVNGKAKNIKKEYQFFETPEILADRLVQLANIVDRESILEPSAGNGAIIKAIRRRIGDIRPIYAVELMEANRKKLHEIPNVILASTGDFLKLQGTFRFSRIIANPPFTKNQDIDHVLKMYELLDLPGKIVSVMSNHWRFANDKKSIQFREFFQKLSNKDMAKIYEIDPGTFKSSGTMISACIVLIDNY